MEVVDARNGQRSDGEIGHRDVQDKICCLCGDIGFSDALLRCPRCGYRLQHTYCSRLYPDKIDKDNWGCEWCIHQQHWQQQEHEQGEEAQRKRIKPTTISTGGGGGAHASGQTHVIKSPKKSSKAVDRWRRLARAAKMGSGRRYKLLADVLCS